MTLLQIWSQPQGKYIRRYWTQREFKRKTEYDLNIVLKYKAERIVLSDKYGIPASLVEDNNDQMVKGLQTAIDRLEYEFYSQLKLILETTWNDIRISPAPIDQKVDLCYRIRSLEPQKHVNYRFIFCQGYFDGFDFQVLPKPEYLVDGVFTHWNLLQNLNS